VIGAAIKVAVARKELIIHNFSERCVDPASYDMRVGGQGFTTTARTMVDIKGKGIMILEPGDFGVVTTYEEIELPNDYAARIGVRSSLTRAGEEGCDMHKEKGGLGGYPPFWKVGLIFTYPIWRILKKAAGTFLFILLFTGCASAPKTPERVAEGVYRGSHPDMAILKSYNIGAVLSLENNELTVDEERWMARLYGIKFYNIPLSELAAPDPADLVKGVETIQAKRGEGIYIHCRRGIDRTGYQIGTYREVAEGWPFDRAYEEVLAHGHSRVFYWYWQKSLKALEKQH